MPLERSVARRCLLLALSSRASLALRLGPEQPANGPAVDAEVLPGLPPAVDDRTSQVLDKLWDGEDLSEAESAVLDAASQPVRPAMASAREGPPGRPFHLLSPPDTGSNLLMVAMQLNFPELLRYSSFDQQAWKHTLEDDVEVVLDEYEKYAGNASELRKTRVVVMTRTPLASLVSLRKAPYFLERCFSRPMDWWRESCSANCALRHHDDDGFAGFTAWSRSFANSGEVYNEYHRFYKRMAQSPRIAGVTFVGYEDLVLTPVRTMQALARALGLSKSTPWGIVDAPAKDHGLPVGRELALQKIRTRAHIQVLGDYRYTMCGMINRSLFSMFVEGTYTEQPLSYGTDCNW